MTRAFTSCTFAILLCLSFAGAWLGCGSNPTEPDEGCVDENGDPLPVAPDSIRVDLYTPVFSDPTDVLNVLHPTADLHSEVLLGTVDGEAFRVEVTLLPDPKAISLNGSGVEALEAQYVAFLDGRIHEVALDWYAEDDLGSVWYLGEDVFNYEEGIVADTEGTWLAGEDGPAAMIMPANPRVGNVYRPENICGLVFEEVTVKSVGVTVQGPRGSVQGAIIVEELHMDGQLEDKTFAPGYGEFFTGSGGDIEALALAVPIDALQGPPPAEIDALLEGADDVFDAAESEDWDAVSAAFESMTDVWATYRATGVPSMLETQMEDALNVIEAAIIVEDAEEGRQGSIDAARAALDFRLRHRPPAEIDLSRFELWARQVLVDAEAEEPGDVRGDAASMEWVRDRFIHTLGGSVAGQINSRLAALRSAADAGRLDDAAAAAEDLREILAGL